MADTAYISFYLRYNRIHIFCKALRDVGKPEYIRLLINADHMRLIMQPYHKKDFRSFRVPKSIYSRQCGGNDRMELHSQAFCLLLANRLGWDTARSYRVPGIIYGGQNLVCFDLNKAALIGTIPDLSQAVPSFLF